MTTDSYSLESFYEYERSMDIRGRAKRRAALAERFGNPVQEWHVIMQDGKPVLESTSHSDDVQLQITGNFSDEQRERIAHELCRQLNLAEGLEAAAATDEDNFNRYEVAHHPV
jgi:hypothetical protein